MIDNLDNSENTPTEPEETTEGVETPTVESLKEQGLNEATAAAIIAGDYAALKKAIDESIKSEVESRLKSNIPKTRQTEDLVNELKSFEKMGYKERLELSKKNPRLYNELVTKTKGG